MQHVKLFKSVEADIIELEREINAWLTELQQQEGRVLQLAGNIAPQTIGTGKSLGSGSFSPSDLFAIVLYEKP
jgi:hypothetical protein